MEDKALITLATKSNIISIDKSVSAHVFSYAPCMYTECVLLIRLRDASSAVALLVWLVMHVFKHLGLGV